MSDMYVAAVACVAPEGNGQCNSYSLLMVPVPGHISIACRDW